MADKYKPRTGANDILQWIAATLSVATLATIIIGFSLIGSHVDDANSVLRLVQKSQLATVNTSCDAKAELRKQSAYQIRVNAAFEQYSKPVPCHLNNGDEQRYAAQGYYSQYSKGLSHDSLGHVNPASYQALLVAAESGLPSDWAKVPLAVGAVRHLTNPLAAEAYQMEGGDSHSYFVPPPPQFNSAEQAAEMVEQYWMALTRDISFNDYATNPLIAQAIADLSNMSDYRAAHPITPQNVFRGTEPGCVVGPYMSQFLYLPCVFGANNIDQRIHPPTANVDFVTNFSEYLNIQNGQAPSATMTYSSTPVFIRNGRDLSHWVHLDASNVSFVFVFFYNSCVFL
ncbi:MAG: hypothetical protein K2Q45_05360 [Nitrosomonas sp.]|nr:hypothetical protein [Nitrosomonas sp.]